MRFVLAISALVLAGVFLILGIGHATFLAGPKAIVHSVELGEDSRFVVIDAAEFDAIAGQANVVVRDVEPFVGYGQLRDVDAWVAPFAHARLVFDEANEELRLERVFADVAAEKAYVSRVGAEPGEELPLPSPVGGDLWLDERSLAAVASTEAGDASGTEATEDPAAGEEAQPSLVTQMVRMPVSLASEQSVLVALAEPGESGAELSVEWVQNRRMPLVGPFLTAGGVLAVVGVVLYLLAVDHDRRGLGPRRGRKGALLGIRNQLLRPKLRKSGAVEVPRRSPAADDSKLERGRIGARRMTGLVATATAVVLLATGCAPSYWPDFSPTVEATEVEPTPEVPQNLAPVPVTGSQIERIVKNISEVSATADQSLDASGLAARFRGDALVQRETNYTIRSAVSDYDVVVPGISENILGYQLVQSTESWPRTMLIVVDSQGEATSAEAPPADQQSTTGDDLAGESVPTEAETAPNESPSLALIMTQPSPHENYLVTRVIALRGGIVMPEAAAAEVGTALLAGDLTSLALPPAEVGAAYSELLTGNTESDSARLFDLEGDSLLARSGAAWVAQATEAAAAAGQDIVYSVTAEQTPSRVISLSTGVGGALVSMTVNEVRAEVPAEGSNWRPTITGSMAALSGLSGRKEWVASTVAHQLLFFVPGAESNEKIQLLGYTSDLIGASAE